MESYIRTGIQLDPLPFPPSVILRSLSHPQHSVLPSASCLAVSSMSHSQIPAHLHCPVSLTLCSVLTLTHLSHSPLCAQPHSPVSLFSLCSSFLPCLTRSSLFTSVSYQRFPVSLSALDHSQIPVSCSAYPYHSVFPHSFLSLLFPIRSSVPCHLPVSPLALHLSYT